MIRPITHTGCDKIYKYDDRQEIISFSSFFGFGNDEYSHTERSEYSLEFQMGNCDRIGFKEGKGL